MQVFRRHIFRKLARVLALMVLLGNSAAVLASVDTLLKDDGVQVPCHMQSKDTHKSVGGCCSEKSDCMKHCNTCTMSVTSIMFVASSHFNLHPLSAEHYLPPVAVIPDGITTGLLYRPPIFSA